MVQYYHKMGKSPTTRKGNKNVTKILGEWKNMWYRYIDDAKINNILIDKKKRRTK